MENITKKIIELLQGTESDLQKLIIASAEGGDYRGVDLARSIAVDIKNLREKIVRPTVTFSKNKNENRERIVYKPAKKKTVRKSKKDKYPKFEIRNDYLVKIGWSKKQKKEYSHKVPTFVFDKTVLAMESLAESSKGPFMAENIIDKVNSDEEQIIPAYQIYVVIALLRKVGCVDQIGREGYEISRDIRIKADNTWNSLKDI